MDTKIKAVLSGLGSLLVFFPATNYASFTSKGNASERIQRHWGKTGEHLKTAMERYNSYDNGKK